MNACSTNDHHTLARGFASRDAWSAGRQAFEDLVAEHPHNAEVRAHLAFFVTKESRYDTGRALALLDEALALDPACANAWVVRALVHGGLREEEAARHALAQAAQCGAPEADLVRAQAWIALDFWQLDEAVAGFEHLASICEESTSCVLLATAYLQAGRHDDAITAGLAAVQRDARDFRGYAYAGIAALAQGDGAGARRFLEEAARLQPASPLVAHALGHTALHQGQTDEAEAWLCKAIALDPLYVTSHRTLGDLYARSERPERARHHYEAALTLFPDYAEARAGLEALPAPAHVLRAAPPHPTESEGSLTQLNPS